MNLEEYLFMKVTPLWDTNPDKAANLRKLISDEVKEELRVNRINNKLHKIKSVIDTLGGEATSVQIGLYLGYNLTSVAHSLQELADKTTFLVGTKITKDECLAKGIPVKCGKLPILWRYNPNGIIKAREEYL